MFNEQKHKEHVTKPKLWCPHNDPDREQEAEVNDQPEGPGSSGSGADASLKQTGLEKLPISCCL